jgi:uncharacterized protein YjbJ (UPF0337 family)
MTNVASLQANFLQRKCYKNARYRLQVFTKLISHFSLTPHIILHVFRKHIHEPTLVRFSPFQTFRLAQSFHCSKTSGQLHSVKGTVVETIGNITGSQSWRESGKREHTEGEAEYHAAKAKGYVEGATDRVGGKKDAILGAVTGDRSLERQGEHVCLDGLGTVLDDRLQVTCDKIKEKSNNK